MCGYEFCLRVLTLFLMSERGEVAENDVPTSHKNEGIFISRKEKHNRRVNKHG